MMNPIKIWTLLFALLYGSAVYAETKGGSVIFIHPDGTSASSWAAARALYAGPDGDLQWDRLPAIAVYRGHMRNNLTATSNSGGTTHAYGVKVDTSAFGLDTGGARGKPILDEQGESLSVAHQAINAGLQVALVQSGIASEPGTACFVASVAKRNMHDEIVDQMLNSGARILFSGGEKLFLPKGVDGIHGPGTRQDGRNLVEEAEANGFTVIHTREEMFQLDPGVEKVLGLFTHGPTFNDISEEALAERGKPEYDPQAPTLAEMTEVALRLLAAKGERFLLVVEEEGTDNFGNRNNASGMLEAMKRADDAIGISRRFVRNYPDTLLITTADSDAGGMRMRGMNRNHAEDPIPEKIKNVGHNGAPIDGADGTGTKPFLAQPDANGLRLPFWIAWAASEDLSGGILVRGEGFRSEEIKGTLDNTEIAKLIRRVLF